MPKLYTLDAMRGIAAFMVAALHFGFFGNEANSPSLAVDFFFALSGFVIAYSYDRKFADGMTTEQFVRRRLIRLYPLYVLGLALGLGVAAIGALVGFTDNGGPYLTQFLASIFFLPWPGGMGEAPPESLAAPLNGPYWSLILEIHINVLFAIFFRWLGMRMLSILVTLFGLGIIATAWNEGTLGTGFLTENFYYGVIRVGFSFLAGVMLCRIRHHIRLPRIHWGVALAIIAGLLSFPSPESLRGLYDAVCVLVFFPLVILAGVGSQPRAASLQSLFSWIGAASYALYAIHVPIVAVAQARAESDIYLPYRLWSVAFLFLTVVLAFAVVRWFDIPVRQWLSDRVGLRRAPGLAHPPAPAPAGAPVGRLAD